MVLKVYGVPAGTNVVRVIAALNKKGLDYELVKVDILSGAHKKPDFLSLNPFGLAPVFEDGNIQFFETGLDLFPARNPADVATLEQWLEIESQQFNPSMHKLLMELIMKPILSRIPDQAVIEAETAKLGKVMDVYEERLSKSKYLAGDEFTLADLNHMPHTYSLLKTPKADLITSRPHVKAWWEDVSARPAWVKTAAGIRYGA